MAESLLGPFSCTPLRSPHNHYHKNRSTTTTPRGLEMKSVSASPSLMASFQSSEASSDPPPSLLVFSGTFSLFLVLCHLVVLCSWWVVRCLIYCNTGNWICNHIGI
uniref:Uncharacterized protein n=1 Tax=Opuntia streptacantha TaxID=393608 RepID=A0A7C9EB55_OPUST